MTATAATASTSPTPAGVSQPPASTAAPGPGAAISGGILSRFDALLTELEGNLAATAMAQSLKDPQSTGSALYRAFQADRAAYLALQSAWKSPADATALRAAWSRMQASRAAMTQWVQDYIPSRLQPAFQEILGVAVLPPLVDTPAGFARSITAAQVPQLSRDQLVNLGTSIAFMEASALNALTSNQVGWLSDSQLGALDERVVHLSSDALESLASARLASLPPQVIAALVRLVPIGLTETQLAVLVPAQMIALSRNDLTVLGDSIKFLGSSVLRSLTPSQVSGAALGALSIEQLGWFSAEQLSEVKATQVSGWEAEKLQALGEDIGHLPPEAIAGLELRLLTQDQLRALTTVQMAQLQASHVEGLSLIQMQALLEGEGKLASIPADAFARLDLNKLNQEQRRQVTADQLKKATVDTVRSLTAQGVQDLGSSIAGLQPAVLLSLRAAASKGLGEQISLLTTDQVKALGAKMANLSTAALATLLNRRTDSVLGSISGAGLTALIVDTDRRSLIVPLRLPSLTQAQVLGLLPEAFAFIDLNKLTPTQRGYVTAIQLGGAVPDTVKKLTADGIKDLRGSIAGLPFAVLAGLRDIETTDGKEQIGKITGEQVAALDTKISALSKPALEALLGRSDLPPLLQSVTAGGLKALIEDPDRKSTVTSRLRQLSLAQVKDLPALAFAGIDLQNLTAQGVLDLGVAISGLPPTVLAGLRATGTAAGQEQISKITGEQIAALDTRIAELSKPALEALFSRSSAPPLLQSVTAGGLEALFNDRDRISVVTSRLKDLSLSQVEGLPPAAFRRFELRFLTQPQRQRLTAVQLASAVPDSVVNLNAQGVQDLGLAIAGLDPLVLVRLRGQASKSASGDQLDEQVSLITAPQVAALDAKIASLFNVALEALFSRSTPVPLLQSVTGAGITALLRGDFSKSVVANHVSQLSESQVRGLTLDDLKNLGSAAAKLNVDWSSPLLRQLSVAQVKDLTLSNFSKEQLGKFAGAQLAQLRASQVEDLSPDQLQALVGEGKLTFIPSDAFAKMDLNKLNQEQRRQVTVYQLEKATVDTVKNLTSAGIKDLISAIAGLQPEVMAGLTAEYLGRMGTTISALSPEAMASVKLSDLTNTQLAALESYQLSKITDPAKVASMTKDQMFALGEQLGALPDGTLSALVVRLLNTTASVNALTPDQIRFLGKGVADLPVNDFNRLLWVSFVPPPVLRTNNVSALTADGIAALVRKGFPANFVMGSLGAGEPSVSKLLPELSPAQLTALRPQDLASLNESVKWLSDAALKSLTPIQMSGVTLFALPEQKLKLLSASQLSKVPGSEISKLGSAQLAALDPSIRGLSDSVLASLSVFQVQDMTEHQVAALLPRFGKLPAAVRESLTRQYPVLLAHYPGKSLNVNTLQYLTDETLQGWTSQEISSLSTEQVALIRNKIHLLRPSAVGGLSPEALTLSPPLSLTAAQVRWLFPRQVERLAPSDVAAFPPEKLQALERNITALSSDAFKTVNPTVLTLDQLRVLGPPQMALLQSAGVNALSAAQFQALGGSVAWLSDEVIRNLPDPLVEAMTPSQVQALRTKVALIRPAAFGPIFRNPQKLSAITPEVISSLTASQVAVAPLEAFSLAQLGALRAEQLSQVSVAQALKLSGLQLQSLGGARSGLAPAVAAALADRPSVTA